MRIDWWTLALQTVNVLVLVWILARFLFRPVADIVAKRQEEANRLLADAAAVRREADEARADVDNVRARIEAQRERLIAEAQAAAQLEKEKLLAQSVQEIGKLRSDEEAAIARDRMAAEQAIVSRASELSLDIARRLLMRLPPNTALSVFLDGLCQKLNALPPESKDSFAAAAGHAIEVVAAAPLSQGEVAQVRAALDAALGAGLSLEFRSDPALIAGIELRSPGMIVSNTWQTDLDRIREELGRARQPHSS